MDDLTSKSCPRDLADYFKRYVEQLEPWDLAGAIRQKSKAELEEDIAQATKEHRTPRQKPRLGIHARAALAA